MLARMNRLGASLLTGIPLLSLDEVLARTDAVTADDIAALVEEYYDPTRLSAAAVGGDEDVFKRALEAVNPELIAA
jgi:predicted Zn-dependent peptidase